MQLDVVFHLTPLYVKCPNLSKYVPPFYNPSDLSNIWSLKSRLGLFQNNISVTKLNLQANEYVYN